MTCLRQLINVSDCPGNCTLFFRGMGGRGGWRDLKSSTLKYKSFSVDFRYRQFLNQYFIFLFEKKSTNSCTVTLEHVVSNPFMHVSMLCFSCPVRSCSQEVQESGRQLREFHGFQHGPVSAGEQTAGYLWHHSQHFTGASH